MLLGAVELVFVAGDLVTFLCAWELMTLATAALVATEHEARASRRAAYLYLVMSHLGTGFLIAGFLMLASANGSLSFAMLLSGGAAIEPIRHILFACFFLGFGVKAGIVPLHVWLPEAHPAAPTSISALMSGVLIKTGIYGMVRVCAFGLGVPRLSWGVIVLIVGGLSAVLGVLYALMQHDLKRLLAYHSIENIGIILLGLGAGMMGLSYGRNDVAAVGLAASLYHVLNHAVFKGLLFLGAGSVVMATGTRQIEQLGGPAAADAVDRPVFSRRRDGDLRSAAAERLRQRVADIPVVPVRVPRFQRAARAFTFPRRWCPPGADDGVGRCLFCESVRYDVRGVAPESCGSGREGIVDGDACATGVARRVLRRARRVPGIRAPRARGRDVLPAWSAAVTGPRPGWTGNGVRAGLLRPRDPPHARHGPSGGVGGHGIADGAPGRGQARAHVGMRRSIDGAHGTRPRPSPSR